MKLFVPRTRTSGLKLFALILLTALGKQVSFSQNQIGSTTVYDENLNPVNLSSIMENTAVIIIVTHKNCIGCIEYLAKEKVARTIIYMIDNLSLTQARQAVSGDCQECRNYSCFQAQIFTV